jgi:hypothetical protein
MFTQELPLVNEPTRRLTELYVRSMINFTKIRTFRKLTSEESCARWRELYREWFDFPTYLGSIGWRFPDGALSPQWRDDIAAEMTEDTLFNFRGAVDAASLVFAHSVLDNFASQCCTISALARPDDWTMAVKDRKLSLEEVRNSSYEALQFRFISEYVQQLAKEPLMKRVELLNQKCQPVPQFVRGSDRYEYDGQRVQRLDALRHQVIHKAIFATPCGSMTEDLNYLERTCGFLAWLLICRYGLSVDMKFWINNKLSNAGQAD